jgi:uncharacterized protein YjbJ (UPF0337 family)
VIASVRGQRERGGVRSLRNLFGHSGWIGLEEAIVDKERLKGAADKAKGAVKDSAGKLMDDKGLRSEGKMDKAKGEAREAFGGTKDSAKR